VAGFSSLADGTRHAALWRGGRLTDLGPLGGPNSSVAWPGLNERGVVVGIAQTATPDPLGEAWSCAAFLPASGTTCLGFVWENGAMTPLPTLGGNNGYATAVNQRGQVVGWAETAVHDPTCDAPQVLQFRAVRWEPRTRRARELRPLPGDSASAATAINARGQVVGISGECDQAVGRFTARHAVLWERDGSVTELPNLGGLSWHTPTAINARGDVVGFSNPPGEVPGDFIAHAFLWTREDGIRDLGTLPGDETSQAQAINARGEVVGVSCGAVCRAVVWVDGVAHDLGALADVGTPGLLVSARDVSDAGVITGDARDPATRRTVAFVATPRGRRW
jgi:probable HAF family extracellular repeat protein